MTNIIHVKKWLHDHQPTETEIRELFQQEGLTPYRWSNAPHDVYAAHKHDYHKVVYVVSGSIMFGFPIVGEPTVLHAGDRLDLPAGVMHNAVVGAEGVVCLEAHR
jgi:quercetin dioxygenase-like cupin family protein